MNLNKRQLFVAALLTATLTSAFPQVIYGMGSHMGQGRTAPSLLAGWIKQSGFTSFRDEVYWGDIESSPGVYTPNSRAQKTLSFINRSTSDGLSPLVVLDYGNKLYDGGDQPYSDEGRAGFSKYSQYIAKSTNSDVKLFEIWNEWNIGSGTRPSRRAGSPEDYVKLVAKTATAIHSVKPDAQVIAGALADDLGNWPWFQEAVKFGLLKYADGISIHLYNYLNPLSNSGDVEFMNRLHQLETILKAASPTKPFKIYVTEIGWPNHQGRGSVSQEMAAANAARFLLSSQEMSSIAGIWFYELQDGGSDPNDKEHHFGFLNQNETEKPVSCAASQIVPLLKKSTLISSETSSGLKFQTYSSDDKSKLLTAIWLTNWTDDTPRNIKISTKSDSTLMDLSCRRQARSLQKGVAQMSITNTPILIQHTGELSIQK